MDTTTIDNYSYHTTTYKLGNKITCIISSDVLSTTDFFAKQQPYTIVSNIEATLNFNDYVTDLAARHEVLNYHESVLESITLSNVPITNKIVDYAFRQHMAIKEKEKVFITKIAQCAVSNTNEVLLTLPLTVNDLYYVFVYDALDTSKLLYHADHIQNYNLNTNPIRLTTKVSDVLVIYRQLTDAFYPLCSTTDGYVSLDLLLVGNENEATNASTIHINKCVLQPVNALSFNTTLNTVDLTFTVINDKYNRDLTTRDNYIVLNS